MKRYEMIKRVALCLLIAMLMLCVASCNGGSQNPADTDGATQQVTENAENTSADTQDEASTSRVDAETTAGGETEEGATEAEASTLLSDETAGEVATEAETEVETYGITEADGVATVVTPTGFTYTMSGYNAIRRSQAVFSDTLTVSFSDAVTQTAFNRFSMTYKASVAMKVYVTYQKNGTVCEDDYFVEAGEGVFSGLVKGFLENAQGSGITSLRLQACEGASAYFILKDMSTEVMTVPTSSTIYIENGDYKLGIDLNWGGTVNYLRDKKNRKQGLTNLVNKHDTGRLIQQSFYGTAGVPGVYQPGKYGEVQWVYNPVQGGDLYGNASRLIDLVIEDERIYIKSQPQDWAMNNQLTPSYMENTYTLKDGHVQVDNRFVDFSGWEHPFTTQELPALYTVSYLDTFVWYDGEDPWKGDTLSGRDDLPFWGDAAYGNTCSFVLRQPNTETWCAWINTNDDYGLGLYVPGVDQYKAGRYEYNGSKYATDAPCNYVAPLNVIKLVSFEALEYSYLLTTGTTQEIRDTFTALKDFSDNASLHKHYVSTRLPSASEDITNIDLTTSDGIKFLTNPRFTEISFDDNEDAAKLTFSGVVSDPSVTIPYGMSAQTLSASDYSLLRIEYMIPTTNSKSFYQADLFICVGDVREPAESVRRRVNLVCDGEYQVIELDLSKLAFWSGDINLIRFDYFDNCSDGDVIYITNISLS